MKGDQKVVKMILRNMDLSAADIAKIFDLVVET